MGEKEMKEQKAEERKNNRRRRRFWFDVITTAIIVVAVGVFAFSGYKLISTWSEYKTGEDLYENLGNLFPTAPEQNDVQKETKPAPGLEDKTEPAEETGGADTETSSDQRPPETEPETEPPAPIDWMSFYWEMKALNPDYVGWIIIEDTPINYPIVQAEDNDYYLHRLFDGRDNFAGTLFADYRSKNCFIEGNTIIHGHNMYNGTMFAGLLKYREEWFYNSHKTFSIYTEEGEIVYEVFAIYATDPISTSYVTEFTSDEQYATWLNDMYNQSVVKPPVTLTADTRIVTLSTCINNSDNRLIVQARRVTP